MLRGAEDLRRSASGSYSGWGLDGRSLRGPNRSRERPYPIPLLAPWTPYWPLWGGTWNSRWPSFGADGPASNSPSRLRSRAANGRGGRRGVGVTGGSRNRRGPAVPLSTAVAPATRSGCRRSRARRRSAESRAGICGGCGCSGMIRETVKSSSDSSSPPPPCVIASGSMTSEVVPACSPEGRSWTRMPCRSARRPTTNRPMRWARRGVHGRRVGQLVVDVREVLGGQADALVVDLDHRRGRRAAGSR